MPIGKRISPLSLLAQGGTVLKTLPSSDLTLDATQLWDFRAEWRIGECDGCIRHPPVLCLGEAWRKQSLLWGRTLSVLMKTSFHPSLPAGERLGPTEVAATCGAVVKVTGTGPEYFKTVIL